MCLVIRFCERQQFQCVSSQSGVALAICGYDFSMLQRFCGSGVVRKAQYCQQMNRGVAHRAWPALKHSEKKTPISLESCFGISTPCANALSHAVERGPAPPIRIAVKAVRDCCQ